MRKSLALVVLALGLAFTVSGVVAAGDEITVSGNVACAHCTLKKADAKSCQDVLVSKDAQGAATEYYITKNDVSEKFGHACSGEKPATVTGTVSEKDGKKWITPSKMEKKG
jgi:hypothetical protein